MAGAEQYPTLGSLVGDTTEFLAQFWTRRPVRVPGAVGHLLGADELADVLGRGGVQPPAIHFAKSGRPVPTELFTGAGEVAHQPHHAVLDPRKAAGLLQAGATMVVDGAERFFERIGAACDGLTRELGHPTDANLYITPPSSRGFAAHWDAQDVLVVQLFGTKQWQLFAPEHAVAPVRGGRPAGEPTPTHTLTLAPGDVLYVPRGVPHAATAASTVSGHCTFSVNTVTAQSYAHELWSRFLRSEASSPSMPVRGREDDADLDAVHEVARRFLRWLPGATADGTWLTGMAGGALRAQLDDEAPRAQVADEPLRAQVADEPPRAQLADEQGALQAAS